MGFIEDVSEEMKERETQERGLAGTDEQVSQHLFVQGYLKNRLIETIVYKRTWTAGSTRYDTGPVYGTAVYDATSEPSWEVHYSESTTISSMYEFNKEIIKWLAGQSATGSFTYMAVGDSTQEITNLLTSLASEVLRKSSFVSSGYKLLTYESIYKYWTLFTNSTTFSEVGIFNNSTAGILAFYNTFSSITLDTTTDAKIFIKVTSSIYPPMMDKSSENVFNFIKSNIGNVPRYIAWGTTSVTISSTTHSDIDGEVFRTVGTYTYSEDIFKIEAQIPLDQATGSIIRNVGLFTSQTGGDLYLYFSGYDIDKTPRNVINQIIQLKIL